MSFLLVQCGAVSQVFTADFGIGRGGAGADGHLMVADDFASPQHARCTFRDGRWQVQDLGSTNGTWLNGLRIYGPCLLAKGDRIRLGHTELTVVPG